jgi:hypothetical protein
MPHGALCPWGFFLTKTLGVDMKRLIGAIVLALTAVTAQADNTEVWGAAMVRAYHSDRTKGYNENTLGLGFELRPEDANFRVVAGFYNNSYNRNSVYAGVTWLPIQVGDLKIGAMAGIISGYPRYDYHFGPVGAAVVAYESGRYGANVMIVPPVPDGVTAAPGTWTFGFQLKRRFD